MTIYRKHDETIDGDLDRPLEPGPVLVYSDDTEAILSCPCGEQELCLRDHKLSFDGDDRLAVSPSILSQRDEYGKCHLFIKDGIPRFCKDSTCPGAPL